jgi:THUMP domain-like
VANVLSSELLGWLVSPSGQEALAQAESLDPGEDTFLAVAQTLARRYPDRLARAAVEQAILRRRALPKFPRAGEMFFLREALEQSSGSRVASYHARRLSGHAPRFDLGCGIGGDALALAAQGPVVAVDRDRLRLGVLQANARSLGLDAELRLVQADLLHPSWRLPPGAVAFADPARRREGRRIRSSAAYDPPLWVMARFARGLAGMGVKLSPAIDRRESDALGAEVEFVSDEGDLKECVLWFGELRTADARATLLPEGCTLAGPAPDRRPPSPILEYLYEPDPAVMRAGLVRRLAETIGAHQLDPDLALLTCGTPVHTPFARRYCVLDVLPFSEKSLRAELRRRGVGKVTLKKRGSAVDTEALGRRLHLTGDGAATVLLTRVLGRPLAILVERIA